MQRRNPLASLIKIVSCSFLVLGTAAQAADDKKADPTGTWVWTQQGRGGGGGGGGGGVERTNTLVLKMDGDKITGKLTSPGRGGGGGGGGGGQPVETDIKDVKVTGDDISFSVTREFGGNSFTTKYSGKISGDSIKGKTEFDRNGETQSRDWEAKRKK